MLQTPGGALSAAVRCLAGSRRAGEAGEAAPCQLQVLGLGGLTELATSFKNHAWCPVLKQSFLLSSPPYEDAPGCCLCWQMKMEINANSNPLKMNLPVSLGVIES